MCLKVIYTYLLARLGSSGYGVGTVDDCSEADSSSDPPEVNFSTSTDSDETFIIFEFSSWLTLT